MCFLCAFFYLQLMYHKILAPIDWTTKRRNNCKIKLYSYLFIQFIFFYTYTKKKKEGKDFSPT